MAGLAVRGAATVNAPDDSDRLPGEAGEVGGVEALVFGMLAFVLFTLVVGNAWAVINAKVAVSTAATDAVRAAVEAVPPSDAVADADAAAAGAIEASGGNPARARVVVLGLLERCARLGVTVTYRVPLVAVPLLGGLGSGVVVTSRRSELVDPYRSGLPGTAACDA